MSIDLLIIGWLVFITVGSVVFILDMMIRGLGWLGEFLQQKKSKHRRR